MDKNATKIHYKRLLKDVLKLFSIKGRNVQVNYMKIIEPMDIGYMIVHVDTWKTLEISKFS